MKTFENYSHYKYSCLRALKNILGTELLEPDIIVLVEQVTNVLYAFGERNKTRIKFLCLNLPHMVYYHFLCNCKTKKDIFDKTNQMLSLLKDYEEVLVAPDSKDPKFSLLYNLCGNLFHRIESNPLLADPNNRVYSEEFIRLCSERFNECGVYFIYNQMKQLIYIGKSVNLGSRMPGSVKERSDYNPYYISVARTKSKSDVHVYEPYFISKLKPIANFEFKEEDGLTIELPKLVLSKMVQIFETDQVKSDSPSN